MKRIIKAGITSARAWYGRHQLLVGSVYFLGIMGAFAYWAVTAGSLLTRAVDLVFVVWMGASYGFQVAERHGKRELAFAHREYDHLADRYDNYIVLSIARIDKLTDELAREKATR